MPDQSHTITMWPVFTLGRWCLHGLPLEEGERIQIRIYPKSWIACFVRLDGPRILGLRRSRGFEWTTNIYAVEIRRWGHRLDERDSDE